MVVGGRHAVAMLRSEGQSEINQDRLSGRADHDVRRVQIAVHDTLRMQRLDGASQAPQEAFRLCRRQHPTLLQHLREAASSHEFHRNELLATDLADPQQTHDTRVTQPTQHVGLTLQPLTHGGGHQVLSPQELERHHLPGACIHSSPHIGLPAGTQLINQDVLLDPTRAIAQQLRQWPISQRQLIQPLASGKEAPIDCGADQATLFQFGESGASPVNCVDRVHQRAQGARHRRRIVGDPLHDTGQHQGLEAPQPGQLLAKIRIQLAPDHQQASPRKCGQQQAQKRQQAQGQHGRLAFVPASRDLQPQRPHRTIQAFVPTKLQGYGVQPGCQCQDFQRCRRGRPLPGQRVDPVPQCQARIRQLARADVEHDRIVARKLELSSDFGDEPPAVLPNLHFGRIDPRPVVPGSRGDDRESLGRSHPYAPLAVYIRRRLHIARQRRSDDAVLAIDLPPRDDARSRIQTLAREDQ